MPVPVASTHNNARGIAAANLTVAETAGPFARLGQNQNGQQDKKPEKLTEKYVHSQNESSSGATQQSDADVPLPISVSHLNFSYPGIDGRPIPGIPPLLEDLSFSLPPGSRCLLIGGNGAGKTTFLKVLGGKHMVPRENVSVLGRPPFHDTSLISNGDLAYIGGNWVQDIAFAGYSVPLAGDIAAGKMLANVPGCDPERRAKLQKVMDINPHWRMHLLSDGQRRRMQLAMGLMNKFKVLLLDEVTVDLDVLGRSDLMNYLVEECETRGSVVMYATHIFDGLESWPTHVAYLSGGKFKVFKTAEELPELRKEGLLKLVDGWLREEQAEKHHKKAASGGKQKMPAVLLNNGFVAGRMTKSLKLSSNAVMRN